MKRLLFFVTEDWYFVSHRLPLAIAARNAGYHVAVATRVHEHGDVIRSAGIELFPLKLKRRGRNPFLEMRAFAEILEIYRSWRPDIVHHVALKPVLYGALAARLTKVPAVINALAGLGFGFDDSNIGARALRTLIGRAYRWSLNFPNAHLIVQNDDDRSVLIEHGIVDPTRVSLIRGAGVDVQLLYPSPEQDGRVLVILPARMLRQKGIAEFVSAAEKLKENCVPARFALVGDVDVDSPASLSVDELKHWQSRGAVEWWGWRNDMPAVLHQAHIVCLPSYYREGVPKALLEAAACGRPIVTCDMPGCRDIVRDEENGLLVPPRDVPALAQALCRLIEDKVLRERMGIAGRAIVEREFSLDGVIAQTLDLYSKSLQST